MKEYYVFIKKYGYLITAACTWLFMLYEVFIWGFPEIIKFVCNLTLGLTLVLAIFHILSYKFRNKVLHAFMQLAAALLVVAWLLGIYVATMFLSISEGVRNPWKYNGCLRDCRRADRGLFSHFPDSIPSNASNVRFFFRPKFMQGALQLQVRYSLPPEEIEKLHDKFEKLKSCSVFGGDINSTLNDEKLMRITDFYTSGDKSQTFPKDYEIMVLDPFVPKEKRNWNHGEAHGVAINKKANEIVYWAELW